MPGDPSYGNITLKNELTVEDGLTVSEGVSIRNRFSIPTIPDGPPVELTWGYLNQLFWGDPNDLQW